MKTSQQKYQDERNKLISQAEHFADRHCGNCYNASGAKFSNREDWTSAWNLMYHSQMNKLSKTITL